MKLCEIQKLLDAVCLSGQDRLEEEVFCGFGSDLMSDVLYYAKEDTVLLTGLVNKQVLNTASMANMHSIIFVRNKMPSPEIIDLAADMDILVMSTRFILFESCGILFREGLKGAQRRWVTH